jgi:hypothetical protein
MTQNFGQFSQIDTAHLRPKIAHYTKKIILTHSFTNLHYLQFKHIKLIIFPKIHTWPVSTMITNIFNKQQLYSFNFLNV